MKNIPKIIHYCWFGESEISEKEKQNIDGWREIFPEYEIKEWNENNFDINQCGFVNQAYEKKQYAFVSDYARAKILYEYGGIYMDTDVEVLNEFPEIDAEGFVGFERRKFLGTAVIGVTAGNHIIKKLVNHYESHDFVNEDGTTDIVANVALLTDMMLEKGLILGGEEQNCGEFHVFPREVFYPKKLSDDEFDVTKETCAIHQCNNSWMTEREKKRGRSKLWIEIARPLLQKSRKLLHHLVGKEKTRKLEIKFRNKLK